MLLVFATTALAPISCYSMHLMEQDALFLKHIPSLTFMAAQAIDPQATQPTPGIPDPYRLKLLYSNDAVAQTHWEINNQRITAKEALVLAIATHDACMVELILEQMPTQTAAQKDIKGTYTQAAHILLKNPSLLWK